MEAVRLVATTYTLGELNRMARAELKRWDDDCRRQVIGTYRRARFLDASIELNDIHQVRLRVNYERRGGGMVLCVGQIYVAL